jgi:dihydrofolate synthase/folylpolyglutamate synthase
MYFERNNADLAVYEVGLGGRLDATNIIKPLVCAITPISYEHTHLLGDTLGRIAFEKAGIIKSGVTCVSAPQEEDALCSIRKACEDKNAKLVLVGDDIKFKEIRAGDDREVFDVTTKIDKYLKLETSILGHHQMVNAAAAIGVVEALRPHGYIIDQKDIRIGVKNAKWSGRLEVIQRHPYVILDGAHNSASADTLASAVRKGFKYSRLRLVLGVSKDKDVKGILEALIPISDLTVITKSKIAERAFHPEKIKEMIADKEAVTTSNVKEALNHAIKNSDPDDLILVTGSLFVVGEAREIFMGKK